MPIVEVHLPEGCDAEATERLARALTETVRQVVPAPPEAVRVIARETVITQETADANDMRGAPPALPHPVEVVRGFLAAMEARDLDAARDFLGDGFAMRFPGATPMSDLQELIDWSAPRYRFVRKTCERFDVSRSETAAVVHCDGTLAGEWPDGAAFGGVRFIDRFELTGGRITRQDVWNDMAEAMARP